MLRIVKKPSSLIKVLKIYWIAETIRFLAAFVLAIEVFRRLDISDYAAYAIVQSLSAVVALLFTLNVDSSMQKVFSRKLLIRYANVSYFLLLLLFFCSGTALIITVSVIFPDAIPLLFGGRSLSVPLLMSYMFSLAINGTLQSYFNASGKTMLYFMSVFSHPIALLIFMVTNNITALESLLFYSALSYSIPILLVLVCLHNLKRFSFKTNRFVRLIKYIISYSLPSFPALGSKLVLEYFARIGVLAVSGEVGVAALAFANTVFSIFRSVERAFYRAVAPFIISPKRTDYEVNIMRKIVIFKTGFIVLLFSLSLYWISLLEFLFPEKPAEVFSALLLWIMALVYVFSLWKNYYMTFCKKHFRTIRRFFNVATLHNIGAIIVVLVADLSAAQYLILLLVVNVLNVFLLRNMSNKIIREKGGYSSI